MNCRLTIRTIYRNQSVYIWFRTAQTGFRSAYFVSYCTLKNWTKKLELIEKNWFSAPIIAKISSKILSSKQIIFPCRHLQGLYNCISPINVLAGKIYWNFCKFVLTDIALTDSCLFELSLHFLELNTV